ncbi:MAG: RNA polymerase sigma factor [Akkermansiaceae bacterium]|nr:RNA polymerase sigma factor [Akkermansiaceae bacterium]NNM29043.1 RNA polymerase sigma factor [Akkermansiaceae bacterium]
MGSRSRKLASEWKDWLAAEGGKLLMYARQRTGSMEDAEDVLQDALARLWGYQEERDYRPPDLALAYSVVRMCGLDWGRKQGRREKKHRKIIELHTYEDHWLDRGAEDDEEAQLLREAVKVLSEKLREVVTMKVWGGLTFAQIADVLKISQNTAASRYRYALEQLEKQLRHLKEARHG